MQLLSKLLTIMALLATITLLAAAQSDPASVILEAARKKEVVDGDLKAAIELYKEVVAKAGSNRAVAAKALLEMGQCHEKLGQAEARKVYERIVNSYSDQLEPAAGARVRLASLRDPSTAAPALAVKRIWAGADVDLSGAPSHDGRYLSFIDWSTGDLALRDLSTGERRLLTNTNKDPNQTRYTYAFVSTFSPDGRWVAYSWCCTEDGRFDLRLADANGTRDAKPRVLYSNEDVAYLQPHGWSPDGLRLLVTLWRDGDRTTQTALVTVSNGAVRVLKTQDWRAPERTSFSPDGRYIVYDFPPKEDSPDRDIFILASDGSFESPLIEHPGNDFVLGWAPDGKNIVFASDRTGTIGTWMIGVAGGRPQGEPQLVKPDAGEISPLGITGNGTFYYGLQSRLQDVYIATLDPVTAKIQVAPTPATKRFIGGNSSAAWSPDGEYIAYLSRRDPSYFLYGPRVLSIRSVKTGQERELSPNLSEFFTAIRLRWSPDGRSLLASGSDNKGRPGLYRINAQTGEVGAIAQEVSRFAQGVWSIDGKAVFYVHQENNGENYDIRIRDLETGQEKELHRPASRSLIGHLALSPDGRWLAFGSSRESSAWWEEDALMVMPATGGEPRELLKLEGGSRATGQTGHQKITAVEWTRDGTHLLYSNNGELWRMPAQGGEPQRLGLKTTARNTSIDVHPDGQRIAFTAGEQKEEVWVMENFLPRTGATR